MCVQVYIQNLFRPRFSVTSVSNCVFNLQLEMHILCCMLRSAFEMKFRAEGLVSTFTLLDLELVNFHGVVP